MTYVNVEDTQWPVDDVEAEWHLRYTPQNMTTAQEFIAADIIEAYNTLTSPLIDDETAHDYLRFARAGIEEWKKLHDEGMRESVAKEWVVEVTDIQGSSDGAQEYSYLLGPYTRAEAEDKAEDEKARNPSLKTVLRKVMS